MSEQSSAPTMECKDLKATSPQEMVVNSLKNKYRKRPDASPESRSGSPYSSDSLSSCSLSDVSASTTPKDTYSNETNETSSSSFDVGSDKEKISSWSTANFDRVLHDAPKREHIRSRKSAGSRPSQGGKCGVAQSDSGSSSSASRPKQAMRSKLHGRTVEMVHGDSENSTSSGSMGPFNQDKDSLKSMEGKKATSVGTDTGIATAYTSGQSVQSQSNTSKFSSSGVDTRQSTHKERKNLPGKSVSSHYHDIRKVSKSDHIGNLSECSNDSTQCERPRFHRSKEEHNYLSDPVSSVESERKRRRFNRTFVLLRHCGLLELTLQTASLMQQSSLMNQQLMSLRTQTEVLYNAIQGLSTSQSPQSFDTTTANGILKNLQDILTRHDSTTLASQQTPVSQHTHRSGVKRTCSGEIISPDSGNAQSSSALHNSGSST